MSVASFLDELRSRDIEVWPDGDQLRCNAPAGVLTPDLRDELRQRKRDIVEFLHLAKALARQERAIVPLQQRGDHAPVFAVPGHNGDVFLYRALAQHLGDDQPFFGLEPPGLDGQSEPLTSVKDLAAYFAAQIRAFRPAGPYVIAGYCAGGAVAFELAQQLVENGATINFVALFAGAYPTWYRLLPQFRQHLAFQMRRVRKHIRALSSLSWRGCGLYIGDLLRRRKERRDDSLATPDPVPILRDRLKQVTGSAVCRYTPRYFDGRVSLFLPSREYVRSGSALLGWRSLVRDVSEYYGPSGCEAELMLLEPYASAIAELFRRCRDNRDPHAISQIQHR